MVLIEKFGYRCFSSHLVSRTEGRSMYGKALVLPVKALVLPVKAKELMIVIHSLFELYLHFYFVSLKELLEVEYIKMPAKVLKFRYRNIGYLY